MSSPNNVSKTTGPTDTSFSELESIRKIVKTEQMPASRAINSSTPTPCSLHAPLK